MKRIAKVIIRGLFGLVVGSVSGAVICALGFALLDLVAGGGTRSLGGIGTIANPIAFSAMIGGITGAFYGAIVGVTNGLVGPGPMRGAVSGFAIGAVVAAYLFFASNDASVNSAVLWIIVTGGVIGLTTGFVLKLLTKKITWLSN